MYETASLSSELEQQQANLRKARAEAQRSNLKLVLQLKESVFRFEKAQLNLEKAILPLV